MGKLRSDYQNLVDELDQAIKNDQVYLCRDLLEHMDPAVSKSSVVRSYFEKHEEVLQNLRSDIENLDTLLGQLNTDEGWKLASKNSKVTVYFQKKEDSPFLMTKAETLLEANLGSLPTLFVKLLSLFNENDLMPKWFPMGVMKGNDCLYQPTKFSKIIQPQIKLPLPLSAVIGPRESVVVGKGYDMSERKAVAISINPLNAGETVDDWVCPETPQGFTRFVMFGAYYFELTPKGISFKLLQQLDLKSKMIPAPILNWLSKGAMPNEFMSKIRDRIKKYEGSIWEERVNANPELYDDVKDRLMRTLQKEYGIQTIALAQEDDQQMKKTDSKRTSRLRRSMSQAGKRLSRGISKRGLIKKQTEVVEEVPVEEVPEPEPEEEAEKGPVDYAKDAVMLGINAVSEVVDLTRRALVTVAPGLKEISPILFKDVEELQHRN